MVDTEPARIVTWHRLLFGAVLVAIVAYGWHQLHFECDDAYINFRYVSNSMLGRGFVWNPEPFLPVEGYTAPLWLAVLRLVWSVTGVEPPQASHWITLCFGLATLVLGWRILSRLRLPRLLVGLALLATATNRVFLTWTTSGLETSMFVFWITSWIYVTSKRQEEHSSSWAAAVGATATLAALTRPDGLLCVIASIVLFAWRAVRGPAAGRARLLVGLLPLGLVAAHLVWRKSFYGEWLPNTYFAKHSSWWIESGLRYAASYVVENGIWMWAVLALLWCVGAACAAVRRGQLGFSWIDHNIGMLAVLCVLFGHFGYYTFAIGGDIFEYRVYAHLTMLVMISGAWLQRRVLRNRGLACVGFLVLVAATHGYSWMHHATGAYRDCGAQLRESFPSFVHPVLRRFETWQRWLHDHVVGLRRESHRYFVEHLKLTSPTREDGAKVTWDGRPTMITTAAGVVGWSLPHVAMIDVYGLNDAVVARNPVPSIDARTAKLEEQQAAMFRVLDQNSDGRIDEVELKPALKQLWPTLADEADTIEKGARDFVAKQDRDGDGVLSAHELFPKKPMTPSSVRRMGHERVPPPGYVEGFKPNARIVDKKVVFDPRESPLTDEGIREHERRFRERR